jgi:thymidine kinase
MSLRVYTGLPASGKTSAIITEMESREKAGGKVLLILSSEHEALTRRPNVKPQGLMGCRDQNKSHQIDDVIDSHEAAKLLEAQEPGTLVVFDEAQYFQPDLVHGWQQAAERGVDILVGTPSKDQLTRLEGVPHELVDMKVTCSCGAEESTHVVYKDDLIYPTHLCNRCYEEHMTLEVDRLLEVVKESEPFPGDLHTYQPFFDIEMNGWGLVRKDCMARLNIIVDAVSRCGAVSQKIDAAVEQPSFVDLGCCSGFFADGMTTKGFLSAGVDVSEDFIKWASQLAVIKGQAVTYTQQDLLEYLTSSTKHYDVISTFATVQWVMAQKGYEAGIRCFDEIFDKADSICIIEMGYTSEPIYNDKITDRPSEIDRDWVLKLMEGSGKFDTIELHPSGENGIWRDIFVGFKAPPTSAREFDDFPVGSARQTSNAHGYWSDTWAGKKLDVGLQAEKSCRNLRLEGWRPDDSVQSTITVSISAQVIGTAEVGAGVFNIELPASLSKDDFFDLTITSSASFSPEDDERQLSYIIRELGFS